MTPEAQKIFDIYNSLEDKRPFTWLKGRSYSEAFVICVGAGPWKFERRKKIQHIALLELGGRDIGEIDEVVDWYPLAWQNGFLNRLIHNIHAHVYSSFYNFCYNWRKADPNIATKALYQMCGCPQGSKVLSLFCRDALGVPAFPIDRHVKRFLAKNNLPTKEDKVIELCLEARLEPSKVAVAFVRAASSMDNPDWSI